MDSLQTHRLKTESPHLLHGQVGVGPVPNATLLATMCPHQEGVSGAVGRRGQLLPSAWLGLF